MPTFFNASYTNTANETPSGFFGGTDIRYFTPQPGTVEVSASCAKLEVLDFGNMEDVLNYLGINPGDIQ